MARTKDTGGEMRFSIALTELETIVRELEGGQLDLEDSIARYERGVELLKTCRAKLEDAQQRITTLIGELEPEDEKEVGSSVSPVDSPGGCARE